MDRRLGKTVVWLAILVFFGMQVPSTGQGRSTTITYKSKDKGAVRAKQALKLATRLVAALPVILEQFRARRRELSADGYPQARIAALLDSTEASLQKEFKKSDFAPLRDHIAEVFDTARGDLGLPRQAAAHRPPTPQALLASLHPALVDPDPDRGLTDRVLDTVETFLADLKERATRKDLTVDLCVLSEPQKAQVSLQSKDGEKIDPTKTNGRLVNLFRGKYSYTVHKRSFPDAKGPINLYDKKQPTLQCDFQDDMTCAIQDRWPAACRER